MKAVMIYDDFDCAAKAAAMLQRAARRAEPGELWDIRPWRVDVLRLAAASDEALTEAFDADVIIFAGRRAYAMPTWIEQWLKNWATRRAIGDAALATIRDEVDRKFAAPIAGRLSRFAALHGLEIITENDAVLASEHHDIPLTKERENHLAGLFQLNE